MAAVAILTVGLTLSLAAKRAWERRGVFLTFAHSPGEAVPLLRHGDFDLCLLGNSISKESRAKLVGVVKEMLHLNVPVISIGDDTRSIEETGRMSSHYAHNAREVRELIREANQSVSFGSTYLIGKRER